MRAVGFQHPGAIGHIDSLVDIDLPEPTPRPRDLLVEVKAVSVNPVDTQVRANEGPVDGQEWKVLGWDAAGVVRSVGSEVALFEPGDEVYYAGARGRQGTNAELHVVDERIVGHKPRSLDWAGAAALPLTAITAWESLFDHLRVHRPVPGAAPALLIIGGAGGVGSMAIQLARARTDVTVIATASTPKTIRWATTMGAHHVVDHSRPLAEQVRGLGLGAPAFVLSTTHTPVHLDEIADLIAPQGRFCNVDDFTDLDPTKFRSKAVAVSFELMFVRPGFETPDMDQQGTLLDEVSRLIDEGGMCSTMTDRLTPIEAATLKKAHAASESGRTHGKVVVDGWP